MIISDIKVQAKVGDLIRGDKWNTWDRYELLESDGYSDKSYRGCEFRYNTYPLSIGVDIIVTGKPHVDPMDGFKSRIKIVVVGDGEPDKVFCGWLYHKEV